MTLMQTTARSVNFSGSGPWIAALLLVTFVAFWPSYLSPRSGVASSYTHLHAFTATLWMLMLIAQPIAIRTRRLRLHRLLGRISYLIAPLVVVSMALLAHHNLSRASAASYPIQTYVLYLQVSLIILFTLSYALAIYYRRVSAVHARFMICTALTLVDPIVIRLMFWIAPIPSWNYQWFTFGLTDALLLLLIWRERDARSGRRVLPVMLLLFIALQIPALTGFTDGPLWQAFARRVSQLP